MTTFDLTPKELRAARALVQACLANMGGDRPGDLEHDEFTWVDLEDITAAGFNKHEAAGLMASLQAKGFLGEDSDGWTVTTAGWRWLDTVWHD